MLFEITPVWMLFLGIAVICQVSASLLYLSAVVHHRSTLNVASWGLWAVLTIFNAVTYASITDSVFTAIIPVLTSLSTLATFSVALLSGSYTRLDWLDYAAAVAGLIAALVWVLADSAYIASLLLQIAFTVGFIPTLRAVWRRKGKEPALPWFLWTIAYITNLWSVAVLSNGEVSALLYPFTAFLLHAAVFSLAVVAAQPSKFWRQHLPHSPKIRSIGF